MYLHKKWAEKKGKNISQDLVFCRSHRGLQKRIENEAEALKPGVRYWGGAWEIEEMFSKL